MTKYPTMDIDRFNFWEKLPNILKVISEAEYVAVDLEMSGIQVDKPHTGPVVTKPTLQGTYDDARSAAMLYTILQFGFTCISWDLDKKSYVTKTFNIPLYPGVCLYNRYSRHLYRAMKRTVTMSTKSLGFLEEHEFDFSDLFHRGVPYMSLAEYESKEVTDFMADPFPAKEEKFDVLDLPKRAMEFRNDVEMKVSAYQVQLDTGTEPTPVKIDGTSGHRLNGLQKRLVHQLLYDKFPRLVALSRDAGHFFEIVKRREPMPDSIQTRQRTARTQVGARILWDAICGQPFVHNIDAGAVVGDSLFGWRQVKTELEQYETRLRNKSPILVGHNMLMDLCFLQSNFVRALPDSLQEFRAITRERLPRIVDTKYLFTREGDEMSPDYSLAECFAAMEGQQLPAVVSSDSHPQHSHHQAGYDSTWSQPGFTPSQQMLTRLRTGYMTAIVFLKKAYQLSQSRDGLWSIASEDLGEGEAIRPPYIPPEDLGEGETIRSPYIPPHRRDPRQTTQGRLLKAGHKQMATVLPPKPDVPEVPEIPARCTDAPRPPSPGNLLEKRDEEVVAKLAKSTILQPPRRGAAPATAPPTPERSLEQEREPEPEQETESEPATRRKSKSPARVSGQIPEWGREFWGNYGNRTRVGQFGFVLYMPKMAGEKMPEDVEEEKPVEALRT